MTGPSAPRHNGGTSQADTILSMDKVTRRFGAVTAVESVDLTVKRGELFALLGSSGCGKTTLLRMIAGFEVPDEGRVVIDGQDMTGVAPYERPVNMVFQSYALFPHMTVAQNVAYGLKQEGMARSERDDRIAEVLRQVELTGMERRKPHQLSGGQRQRVALARGLAKRPKILLLDEPLGALDRKLRERTQFELVNLQERIGTTFVIVTHDQEEAMTMSHRIAVMDRGRIHQIGAPRDVYEFPTSRFVADFIGTANLLDGVVESTDDRMATIRLQNCGLTVRAPMDRPAARGDAVTVMVRPEKITPVRKEDVPADGNTIEGVVTDIAYLGDISIYHVQVAEKVKLQVSTANRHQSREQPLTWDDRVTLAWHPGDGLVLTA